MIANIPRADQVQLPGVYEPRASHAFQLLLRSTRLVIINRPARWATRDRWVPPIFVYLHLLIFLATTVQTAQESCSHLLKVINSILDYSKLEAGGVRKLEYTGFAVEGTLRFASAYHRRFLLAYSHTIAIVADCIELLAPTAAKNGLDLSYNIDSSVPAWVLADYERVRQIIMVRYTSCHGRYRY